MKSKRVNHGLSKSRLYSVWADMKRRCNNPNRKDYKYIIKSLEEGKTQTSIAKFLGMTTSGVNDAVKRLKWKEYRKRKK